MKVKIETGPLAKDNETPFCPNRMFADTADGWRIPVGDSTCWGCFATSIADRRIAAIIVITPANEQYTFTKEPHDYGEIGAHETNRSGH